MPDAIRVPSLRLTELDGSPDIQGVERIYLTNGFLSNLGGGAALLSLSGGGAGASLTVQEVDGSPSVVNVTTIKVPNSTLTDNTGGVVTLASPLAMQDIDGSPNVSNVSRIYTTNGFLSDLGGGSVLLSMSGGGGGGAPTTADYWVETADAGLSAEVVVGTTGITTTAYASRQVAAKAGRLFLPNDGFYWQRDSGSAWDSWGRMFAMTEPVSADWSAINFTGATLTIAYGGMHIQSPSNGSAQSLRMYAHTLPAAPYTVTVAFDAVFFNTQFSQSCVGLRDTGTDDSALFIFKNDSSTFNFAYEKWTSNTSGAASSYISTQAAMMAPRSPTWIRFQDDNTNRILSWSATGREGSFVLIHSVSRTDFVTPNQFCFGTNAFSQITGITLYSYKETTP